MTIRNLLTGLGLTSILALGAGPAAAGDDGLYEDVFDPQSSFIRVLAPEQAFAAIDGGRVDDFEAGLSSYVNVMPGEVDIVLADTSTSLDVAPSTHYTVIFGDDGEPEVVVDALELSPAKADVTLVNMTERDGVELFVPAARAVAIPGVAASAASSVALKAPLTLDFGMRAGDETLATVAAVDLRRQSGVTVVLTGTGGAYEAVAIPNGYVK